MAALTQDQIVDELNGALTPFFQSLAQYLLETNPFTTDKDGEAIKAVREVAGADGKAKDEITNLIEDMEGIPQPGLADPLFAELNYLSFPYILDVLIQERRERLTDLRRRIVRCLGSGKPAELLKRLADEVEAQSKKLEDIREAKYPRPQPAKAAEKPAA
jgi:hypothetical protein